MASSYNELFGLGTHSEPATTDAFWLMQDTSGTTVTDSSSNANNGTLQGGYDISDITTTGPTTWLSYALGLNGMSDYASCGAIADFAKTDAFTVGLWVKPSGAINSFQTFFARQRQPSASLDGWSLRVGGSSARKKLAFFVNDGGDQFYKISNNDVFTSSQWYFVAASYDGSNSRDGITLFRDGSTLAASAGGDTSLSGHISYNPASELAIGARDEDQGGIFDGVVGMSFVFSEELTSSEIDEVYSGPEPLNTVAGAITGDATVGEVLTCSAGTWDDADNGTVTVGFVWTRSDDNGGTNETDIPLATGNTYTLTDDDAGKYIRCRTRGTNDGGYDSAQDTSTAFTDQVETSGAAMTIFQQHYTKRRVA